MQMPRCGVGRLLGQFGMGRFAVRVGIERRAAVVAVLERETMLQAEHLMQSGFAQHALDLPRNVGVLIFGFEQGPDHAMDNLGGVGQCEADAVFLELAVMEGRNDCPQAGRRDIERGLQEGNRRPQ